MSSLSGSSSSGGDGTGIIMASDNRFMGDCCCFIEASLLRTQSSHTRTIEPSFYCESIWEGELYLELNMRGKGGYGLISPKIEKEKSKHFVCKDNYVFYFY